MQTPKGRNGSSGTTQRVSPRICQPKTLGLESDSGSSSSRVRTPKDKSPKVTERRSPRSPASEKKRPSRISELESQVSQLQEELKKLKEQLSASESWKKQALEDAEESKKQLSSLSSKLEESQKQLLELSASEEAREVELHDNTSQEQDQAWQSEPESVQQQHSVDSAALASALNEIKHLKLQLEMVGESETSQNKQTESADTDLTILKGNLKDTLSLVESMKNQLRDSKESEAQAQEIASSTLMQLEAAKRSVEALQSDGLKAAEAYSSIAAELDQSRSRVNMLEGLVRKLEADLQNASSHLPRQFTNDHGSGQAIAENQKSEDINYSEAEMCFLKSEVDRLATALEAAELKCHEETINNTVQIRNAYEMVEQIKHGATQREAELESQLEQSKADIEELKADLMDKETELQGISEENEGLNMKLKSGLTCQREFELENELKILKGNVAELKACLMDKETELQNIAEENETLRVQLGKRTDTGKADEEVIEELEAARTTERDALVKLGLAMEEADKSSKRAARVTEQLEAAQLANTELEAELRRLKVQSNQWRKAAETAAAMLSAGNNGKFMERTGSMDNKYDPVLGKISSPYHDDTDDDLLKKKNGNMLKKIGVLWKKPHK